MSLFSTKYASSICRIFLIVSLGSLHYWKMSSQHQHSPTVYHNLCKFSDPSAVTFLHVFAELTRLWEISAKHFKDHNIKKHIAISKQQTIGST